MGRTCVGVERDVARPNVELLALGHPLSQGVLVREDGGHQIRGHGIAGPLGHLLQRTESGFGRLAGRQVANDDSTGHPRVCHQALGPAIGDRPCLGFQHHVCQRRDRGVGRPGARRDQPHVAQGFRQRDAARCAGSHATRSCTRGITVDAGSNQTGPTVQFQCRAQDARRCRGAHDAVSRQDLDVIRLRDVGSGGIGASGQELSIPDERGRHDLADLERLLLRQGAADQLLDPDGPRGLDVESSLCVLDLDDHIAVGLDLGQCPDKHSSSRHLERIGGQGNGHEVLCLVGDVAPQRDAAGQTQCSGGLDIHRGRTGAHSRRYGDRVVGLEAVGVEVLQTTDRGLDGGDDRFTQPATAGFGRALDGDFLVGKRAVQAVLRLLGRPVGAIGALDPAGLGVVKHIDPLAGIGGIGLDAGLIQHTLATGEVFDELPLRSVGEVGHREGHPARVTHILVQLVGAHVAHQRDVFRQVHGGIALAHIVHQQGGAGVGRSDDDLGLQQRCAVGELLLDILGLGVRRQKIPVKSEEVEAALLVGVDLGLGHRLTFGPRVVAARHRVVVQRQVALCPCVGLDPSLGVDGVVADAAHRSAAIGLEGQRALLQHPGPRTVLHREDLAAQGGGVGDGDGSHPVLRHIDRANRQFITALVVDLDRGIATGHLDVTIAGADDGAGQVDLTASGLDVFQDDQSLVGIKEAIDCDQVVGPEADALSDVACTGGEIDRAGGRKVGADGEFDGVHTALHQAIDVQIAGIDVDGAHGEHHGLARFLEAGRQAVVPPVVQGP